MTDHTHILPDTLVLERDPADTTLACRSWEVARIVIAEDGTVCLDVDTRYGGDGTPMAEHHRRVLAYTVASAKGGSLALDIDALREDLAEGGTLATLIDRIIDGHAVEWDGSNNIGVLDEDASEADEALRDALDGGAYVSDTPVMGAVEWLRGSNTAIATLAAIGLAVDADDAAVAAKVAELSAEADGQDVILVGDVVAAIRGVIEDAKRAAED